MENNAKDLKIEVETPEMSEEELDDVSGGLKKVSSAQKSLQNDNKLCNFEIQNLMSNMNQAQSLASSVMKKRDDTANGIIGKI